MVEKRMQEIEARIRNAPHLSDTERQKLLSSLATLRSEIDALSQSHSEDAHSITHFLDASTHEASRATREPKLVEAASSGLTASVEKFETTHPKLFQAASQVALILGNMGL
jgi:hypothetical protein